MKKWIFFIPMLFVGLLGLHGCYAEGDWYPDTKRTVRKQTSLDKQPEKGHSVLDEYADYQEYPITFFNGLGK